MHALLAAGPNVMGNLAHSKKGALLGGGAAGMGEGGLRAVPKCNSLRARRLGGLGELEHLGAKRTVQGLGGGGGNGVGEKGTVRAGGPCDGGAAVEAVALFVVLERVALVLDLLEQLLGAVSETREFGETCGKRKRRQRRRRTCRSRADTRC